MLYACARDRLHDEGQTLLHERGGEKLSHRGFLPQDAHHDVLPGGCCGELFGIVQGPRNDSEILVRPQKRLCPIGVAHVGGDGVPLL